MNALINQAAEIIAKHNPQLAKAWLSKPFSREAIACAFSRGFVVNESDDPPAFCLTVLKVAMLEKRMRASMIGS